jgi:dTDP-4-amino-4,6-dideoxygalactose transaminase
VNVPFLDLVTPHRELESELIDVARRAIRSAGFIGGPMVSGFESAFAEFCGTSHAVGVGNGTDALLFALIAAGVRAGDVVVTVPHTFIATVEAILHAGASPEFVDVDERTGNIDPARLRAYFERACQRDGGGRLVSRRSGRPVTAVVPVHLYGQMADMDPILDLADGHGVMVIEDACQAHGAEYRSGRRGGWRRAGSLGRAAAFSFYPGKNLGACGEAGAVTTNDAAIAATVAMLRDHGQGRKYHHDIDGYNGRLDAMQAGFLQVKIAHLDRWNAERRERAARYATLLGDIQPLTPLVESPASRGVYHLYVVRVPDRDRVIGDLAEQGIGTGIHYPVPLHLQRACAGLGYAAGAFPAAERLAAEVVSLPMYPQLTENQQTLVADALRRVLTATTHAG